MKISKKRKLKYTKDKSNKSLFFHTISMSTLLSQLESLLKNSPKLTRQDVLEMTECILQEYLNQQMHIHTTPLTPTSKNDESTNSEKVKVEKDKDGDYIDKDGYIYNIDSGIRIGEKDLKTQQKTMYNIV